MCKKKKTYNKQQNKSKAGTPSHCSRPHLTCHIYIIFQHLQRYNVKIYCIKIVHSACAVFNAVVSDRAVLCMDDCGLN